MSGADILIVDDEEDIRSLIQGILEDEGYVTRQAANSAKALAEIEKKMPDLVVLDIWLQGSDKDGLQILSHIKSLSPHLPVLMISGHGTIETAVTAIKQGAYDFIEKPFKSDRLLLMIHRALETATLRRENETLRQRTEGAADMVGSSHAMTLLRQNLLRIAPSGSRVLITGEAGSGKDLAARFLHRNSKRASGPLVALSCAILHPERLESELFGTESAGSAQKGVLEKADGGTLVFDEVADMPLETQGKIVRILQDQRFTRIGGHEPVQVDVRIMATTSRNLEEAIAAGRFREDLYYRLNVVPVHVPALRERASDVPELAGHFAGQYSSETGQPARRFSAEALSVLQGGTWPGNVRQLKNAIERIMILAAQGAEDIGLSDLPADVGGTPARAGGAGAPENYISLPLRDARESFEREYLLSQVARFGGNISKTAQFVGMERSALHRKLKALEIPTSEKQDKDPEGVSGNAPDARKRA